MGFVSPLADGFPRVDQRLAALHVGVWRQGTVLAAALFRGVDLQRELPFGAYGAAGSVPNRSWDEALASLDWPRLGRWLRYEPEQMWLAEVGQSASVPAGLPMVASRPDARYLVLTRARDGSGLVYGPIAVVRAAARVRLVDVFGRPARW